MRRLVAYTRVSSLGQLENTSLENQLKRIQGYVEWHGDELVGHFRDVLSAGGKKIRPGLQSALDMTLSDEADGIIVYALDRFARSVAEGLRIMEDLAARGKKLIILDLNLDTSNPTGECIFTVLLALAQLERKTIRKRCEEGTIAKKEAGGYHGGRPPYGWDAVGKTLVPNPLEQRWRRYILDLAESGMSFYGIARLLNQAGVLTKSQGKWRGTTVAQLIHKPPRHPVTKKDIYDDDATDSNRERAS